MRGLRGFRQSRRCRIQRRDTETLLAHTDVAQIEGSEGILRAPKRSLQDVLRRDACQESPWGADTSGIMSSGNSPRNKCFGTRRLDPFNDPSGYGRGGGSREGSLSNHKEFVTRTQRLQLSKVPLECPNRAPDLVSSNRGESGELTKKDLHRSRWVSLIHRNEGRFRAKTHPQLSNLTWPSTTLKAWRELRLWPEAIATKKMFSH